MRHLLTEREKKILRGEKQVSPEYKRKVLCEARKKARAGVEDLVFLSKMDPKTEALEMNPELLLVHIEKRLEKGKIPFKYRVHERHEFMKKPGVRKGLPPSVKKELKEQGEGEFAKAFDGKVMVQLAGALRDKEGAPLKIDIQSKFTYDLLLLIHKQLLANDEGLPWSDKTVIEVYEGGFTYSPDLPIWLKKQREQKDNLTRAVLLRY